MAPFFNRLALEDREREGGKGEGRGERGEERKKTTATEEGAGGQIESKIRSVYYQPHFEKTS